MELKEVQKFVKNIRENEKENIVLVAYGLSIPGKSKISKGIVKPNKIEI